MHAGRITEHRLAVDLHVIGFERGAGHRIEAMLVYRRIPSLGDAVADFPRPLDVVDFPLIRREPFGFQRVALRIQRFEITDEAADVHHLVGARRGGSELINRIFTLEIVDGELDFEQIISAVVEIDFIK
ncbi:MAG: hypothetical protein ILNGONEN_00805 [Syntrophorhabdaceae bacterium]|nr:hypothetical protein [Syntrophorhabdaceae bacterium]